MSKVIKFSRVFPKTHPKAGQPTYFVEQIYNCLYSKNNLMDYPIGLDIDESIKGIKHHTIRAGNRFKVGEKFSPRVWSGKPYKSKQIIIAPDIEVKKVYDFEIEVDEDYLAILIDGKAFWESNFRFKVNDDGLKFLAKNDGLELEDFKTWFGFKKPFKGQIICWSDSVNY